MKVSLELIDQLAEWSKLALDQEEKALMTDQLDKMIKELDIIEELEFDDIDTTFGGSIQQCDLREDRVRPSMDRGLILENAPDTRDNMFVVPICFMPNISH